MHEIPIHSDDPQPIPLERDERERTRAVRDAARQLAELQRVEEADCAQSTGVARHMNAADVERTIGGRVFAAIGAIAVIIGAALFLKLAVDKGWFGGIPPALKCLSVAAFGGALIAAGEAARRWINDWASSGLSAAGVGALYAAAYAAHGVYSLISPLEAVGLFALAALIGVGVAARSNLLFVAIVSIVGGYLSPLLFADMQAKATIIPINTFLMLIVGLALPILRGERFRSLPTIVWWGTLGYGFLWVFGHELGSALTGADLLLGGLFLALSWIAIHVELAIAARRGALAAGDGGRWRTMREGRRILASFSSTAWAIGLGVVLMRQWNPGLDWAPAAMGALACTWMAIVLAGNLRAFKDAPENDTERLGAALATQAGACVLLTVLLTFAGWALGAAWLALGLAALAAGAWMRSNGLSIYGMVALALGSLRVLIFDSMWLAGGVEVAGLRLTTWTAMAALAGGSWIACAGMQRWRKDGDSWAIGAMIPGVAFLYLSLLHENVDLQSLCVAYAAMALLIAVPARLFPALGFTAFSLGGFLAANAVWVLAYPLGGAWAESEAPLMLHPGLWTAFLITAGAAISLWNLAPTVVTGFDRRLREITRSICGVWIALFLFLATSLEAARIGSVLSDGQFGHRAALSIWWAVFASGLLIAGWLTRISLTRYAGLGLLGVALLKTLSYDMAGVPAEWRVASFLAIGLLMIAVAVGYARAAGQRPGQALSRRAEDPGNLERLLRLIRRSDA